MKNRGVVDEKRGVVDKKGELWMKNRGDLD